MFLHENSSISVYLLRISIDLKDFNSDVILIISQYFVNFSNNHN